MNAHVELLEPDGSTATGGAVAGIGPQHTSISMYSGTTVVRAPEPVVRGRWHPAVPGFIGEELLLNHRRSGRDLGMQLGVARFYAHDAVLSCAHGDLRETVDGPIALPRHQKLRSGPTSTVSGRRSTRDFTGRPVTRAGAGDRPAMALDRGCHRVPVRRRPPASGCPLR